MNLVFAPNVGQEEMCFFAVHDIQPEIIPIDNISQLTGRRLITSKSNTGVTSNPSLPSVIIKKKSRKKNRAATMCL